MENEGLPRAEAWPITGLEMDCPNCHQTVQELGSDPRDITGYDPDEEGEKVCPFCDTLFVYYIPME